MTQSYYTPKGGLPPQGEISQDKSVFTESYALISKNAHTDIVTSSFPHWEETRAWVLARPLSGFAESFAQYIMEVAPGGGADNPELDPSAEAVLFVTDGELELNLEGKEHTLSEGGYAYIPPDSLWSVSNDSDANVSFHWIRKHYDAVDGIETPEAFVTNEKNIRPVPMPDTNNTWSTTRFVDPDDLRHDMHVNIVNFEPGGVIPFDETHIMEHGLYVLEGSANYRLNTNWHEVEAGDFMWLRAFCPQSCQATGTGRFRYLLYKDVNRHPKLKI